jgi:uncharacterized protein DUF4390
VRLLRFHPALLWAAMAAMSFGAASPAVASNELGLIVDPPEMVGGNISVSYRIETPFTPRLEETLFQGMPATIAYEVGVWKRRAFWFDKSIVAMKREHKVAFVPWAKSFRVRSGFGVTADSRSVTSLDSLKAWLFQERRLALVPAAALDSTGSYYVSVRITIRPVTEEDLGELEDWLAGESPEPEQTTRGLPRTLLGIAAGLSGLGDRTALVKSERFVPARLAEAPAHLP